MVECREKVAKMGLLVKPGRRISVAENELLIGLVQYHVGHLGTSEAISSATESERDTVTI